ncbi:MAG TPA: mechanosensitive ion channel [Caulobacteraceae bacterium]|jgi:hypothetical protein
MYTDNTLSMEGVENWLAVWGPKILGAIAILVVAYFVGKGVKWALAKGIDRIPGTRHVNEGADRKATIGARLGDVGYWLVLLVGVILALNMLNLTGVVTPLNAMLTDFMQFVPHLVGAIVLFFVGFIVATIAKRLVVAALEAANFDRWMDKAGIGRATGASGLANAIGTLVFVLILIPTAIAALQVLQIRAISDPAVAVLATILDAIPHIIAALIVLAIAFVIARWVSSLIQQLLPSLGFDRALGAMMSSFSGGGSDAGAASGGATSPMGDPGVGAGTGAPAGAAGGGAPSGMTPSKVLANVAFAAIMIFAAIEAANLLQFEAIAQILNQILELGGQVLFGGIIIAAGVIIANLLATAIDRSTNGADSFASDIVKWATIALATAMGLRFMGLADDIVTLAFGLILGAAAIAFGVGGAIAFGLGGRETASRWLERLSRKAEQRSDQPPGGGMTGY